MRKIIFSLLAILLTACAPATLPPLPTIAPFPTFTPEPPLFIPTLTPTRTREPLPTSTPTLAPTATPTCDLNLMLAQLKKLITYKEFDLTYNTLFGTRTLNIWLVEPKLDPVGAVGQNINTAALSAATAVEALTKGDKKCLPAMTDALVVIVVDRNYDAWYGGTIKIGDAVTTTSLEAKLASFSVSYVRNAPGVARATPPAQTCKWSDVRAKLQKLFPATRENIGFEFVIDDTGNNVYVQWEGQADATVTTNLLKVAGEVKCLYPLVDQLVFIVVDPAGQTNLVAQAPGAALRSPNAATDVPTQVKVLYPQR